MSLDASLPSIRLATLPTPLSLWRSGAWGELWLKNDGLTSPLYGGNKVRKLELLLGLARQQGKSSLMTVGPAGSHHVLATTLHGEVHGYRVKAVLTPQLHSAHAEHNLLAALEHGLQAQPLVSATDVARVARQVQRSTDLFIGPGAMGALGASAYVFAVRELAEQLKRDGVPVPDALYVAAGSGSTAAGLLAGVCLSPLARTMVVAVQVSETPMLRAIVLGQARAALKRLGARVSVTELNRRLHLDTSQIGAGYAHPTAAGDQATKMASAAGLGLDATYTAKALAVALQSVGELPIPAAGPVRRYRRVIYWHTLSSRRASELLTPTARLPGRFSRLFTLS